MEIKIDGVRYVPAIPTEDGLIPFHEIIGEARERKCETLDVAADNMDVSKSHGLGKNPCGTGESLRKG